MEVQAAPKLFSIWIAVPGAIDLIDETLDLAVSCIRQIPLLPKVAPKEKRNRLVEPGIHATLVFFDDLVTIITGLAIDEFHQHFALVNGKIG